MNMNDDIFFIFSVLQCESYLDAWGNCALVSIESRLRRVVYILRARKIRPWGAFKGSQYINILFPAYAEGATGSEVVK